MGTNMHRETDTTLTLTHALVHTRPCTHTHSTRAYISVSHTTTTIIIIIVLTIKYTYSIYSFQCHSPCHCHQHHHLTITNETLYREITEKTDVDRMRKCVRERTCAQMCETVKVWACVSARAFEWMNVWHLTHGKSITKHRKHTTI